MSRYSFTKTNKTLLEKTISEDKYDNVILLSAKQVYETTAESGKLKAWGYYDKVCSKDYNIGDKWTYVKKKTV